MFVASSLQKYINTDSYAHEKIIQYIDKLPKPFNENDK